MAEVILGGSGKFTVYHGSHRFGKAAFVGRIPKSIAGDQARKIIADQVKRAMSNERPIRLAQGPDGGIIMEIELPDLSEWAESARAHPNRNAGWVIE